MANQNITIPVGKQSLVTVKAFDAATSDITVSGQVTAQASDPQTVQVTGGTSPNSFFVAVVATGTATVTYTYTNSGGMISETDTINPPDPPTSMTVSYAPAV